MSSDDRKARLPAGASTGAAPSRRAFLGFVGLTGAGALLAGCQVRPLYSELGAASSEENRQVQNQLAAISISSAGSRADQVLRNELIYYFTGGGDELKTRYHLRFITSTSSSAVAVQVMSQVPASYILTMTANFMLTDTATQRTVLRGVSTADASYDFSSQRFANLRAQQDAENRAAKTIASDMRVRIAAYFASEQQKQGH